MKILHICLAAFYIDNYSYQENLLPKFHKKMGYEVEILASLDTFNEKGEKNVLKKSRSYINEYNIRVTRIPYKFNNFFGKKLKIFPSIYNKISKINPDIIFVHGCQFFNAKEVVKFAKKKKIRVIVDNHADFSNSARNWFSKNIMHKILWKRSALLLNEVTETFFGVLPARVDFLINMYNVPADKCKLLVMGGDDDFIDKYSYIETREKLNARFSVSENDFVVITAGKIDTAKLEVFNLIQAVKNMNNKAIKLIIFGSVVSELEDRFFSEVDNNQIIYGGWMNTSEAYMYFKSSDLIVFPGRHSVYWEQVASVGKPMILKEWTGTKHINLNNNIIFLTENTVEELYEYIEELYYNKDLYKEISNNAKEISDYFRYSKIAIDSLV